MLRASIFIVLLTGLMVCPLKADQMHWAGEIRYLGDAAEIRLALDAAADDCTAQLDWPGLVMAGEPVPCALTETGFEVALPFGIGVVPLEHADNALAASRILGGERMTVELAAADPPTYRIEPMSVTSGDANLVGDLYRPDGEGPFPAMVLIHGASTGSRESWGYRSWADVLARHGVAALVYDRRGEGTSEGDSPASIRQSTDDAGAWLEALAQHPAIDGARLGLKGSSQGAWPALRLAAERKDVAFLWLSSAATGTPRDQDRVQLETGMRVDGMAEADIQAALSYHGLYFFVAATGRGWPLLAAEIPVARETVWGQYVDQPRSLTDLHWWRENHDVVAPVAAVPDDLPVLVTYGGNDWITPPAVYSPAFRQQLGERGTVRVFDGADHRLELPAGPDATGQWRWPRIADGLLQALSHWLGQVTSGN